MTESPNLEYDTIIVGAGLAGLSSAIALHRAGKRILLLEGSGRVGGRLRTDTHDGFLLDHGFQVMLTAYSECQRLLDYDALGLGHFEPGAYLWTGQKLEIVADPIRQPQLILRAIASSAGSLRDKLRIAALKRELSSTSVAELYQKPERSTRDALLQRGFSTSIIDRFLAPFFSGIFLEPDLATTSRMFEFVFRTFGQGHAALPAKGMAAIPAQLAAQLPPDVVRLQTPVESLTSTSVRTAAGETLTASHVIIATDMTTANRLAPSIVDRSWNATQCFYFSANRSPLSRPMIALNASGSGCIQNVCVPSDVSKTYAPSGQNLICVSTNPRTSSTPSSVQLELEDWFGPSAQAYKFLHSYHIPQALPRQLPGDLPFENSTPRTGEGMWICGDHRYSSSIEGALRSGHQTATAILNHST